MARADDLPTQITLQNGKKIFVKKIAFTSTAGVTNIKPASGNDAEGNAIEAGATLMLQADQDFYYQLLPAGASTSVTVLSGARPGTLVQAGTQEFVHTGSLDTQLDIVRSTADGTVVVFRVA